MAKNRSLFETLFGGRRKEQKADNAEIIYNGLSQRNYTRALTGSELYDNEIVRSCVQVRAQNIAKLKISFSGSAQQKLKTALEKRPNVVQTWYQFLQRLSTSFDLDNIAYIMPTYDEYGGINGVYAPVPNDVQMVEYNGDIYYKARFWGGKTIVARADECGVMQKHQYKNDLYSEDNSGLCDAVNAINSLTDAISESARNSMGIGLILSEGNFTTGQDATRMRDRLSSNLLNRDATRQGIYIIPKGLEYKSEIPQNIYSVADSTLSFYKDIVLNYYQVNENILNSTSTEQEWASFFENVVSPFAIQLSEVMTKMLFSMYEQGNGNRVQVSLNRLQATSIEQRLKYTEALADRGVLTVNEIRELFDLPLFDGDRGNVVPVRGEYKDVNELTQENN